ncbi:MAG: hypothetical protein HC767_06170 [Akkermansiaceae bacterium]|nr:hypothetical protein [Akkermansiaceae bacterium]
MSHLTRLDQIVASLAKPLTSASDTLLDLRTWAASGEQAGSCVAAYFQLLDEAPREPQVLQDLSNLCQWLDENLSILVFDGTYSALLEDMPFSLLGYSDLETFCHQAIQKLWKDRCYSGTKIGMRFTFHAQPSQCGLVDEFSLHRCNREIRAART